MGVEPTSLGDQFRGDQMKERKTWKCEDGCNDGKPCVLIVTTGSKPAYCPFHNSGKQTWTEVKLCTNCKEYVPVDKIGEDTCNDCWEKMRRPRKRDTVPDEKPAGSYPYSIAGIEPKEWIDEQTEEDIDAVDSAMDKVCVILKAGRSLLDAIKEVCK